MTRISTDNSVVTLINVFTVEPKDQQRLIDMLVAATDHVMKRQPGFVSANIHKSADGMRVANYAQWQSRADFEAAMKNPEVREHIGPVEKIATADAHLYEVVEARAA